MNFEDYETLPTNNVSAHMTAGAIAGIMEHCVMYPLDSVKVCQVGPCNDTSTGRPYDEARTLTQLFDVLKVRGWEMSSRDRDARVEPPGGVLPGGFRVEMRKSCLPETGEGGVGVI